jgi:hypothetical protein
MCWKWHTAHNQHGRGSDFAFSFFAVYVQRRLIFCRRFLYVVTTCIGLTVHHQVLRLLRCRNLLLTVMLIWFSYVLASDSSLCALTSCFIWVSMNNCSERVRFMVLLVCWFVTCGCPESFVWAEVCCMALVHCGRSCNRMLRFNIVTGEIETSTSSNLSRKAIYIKRLFSN